MNRHLAYLVLTCILFLWSCAQVVPPSGGPRDTTPPFVIDSLASPPNYATNFNATRIVLPFNEYVQIKDVRNQVIISPPFAAAPDFKLKGKELIIDLNAPLAPNTTYTINFGDAVTDNNEGLVANNLKYVFSTGAAIDSLQLQGSVVDAYSCQPIENAFVMLYSNQNDSTPINEKPDYFSKTNKNGAFAIDFIKAGSYRAFALIDGNYNYLYDLPNEAVAFADEPVVLPSDSGVPYQEFFVFTADFELQYRKSAYIQAPGPALLVYNRPLENPKVVLLDLPQELLPLTQQGVVGDSLWLWFNPNDKDSIRLEVKDDTGFRDTVFLDLQKKVTDRTLTATSNANPGFDLKTPLILNFSEPVTAYNSDELKILTDSLPIPFTPETRAENPRQWTIKIPWESGKSYKMILPPGSVTGQYSTQTDTLKFGWSVRKADFFGALEVELELPDSSIHYRFEILQGTRVIKAQTITSKSKALLKYPQLPPGKYNLRIVYDENKNGRWDVGSYLLKKQPEKVYYFKETVEVRSKWQQSVKWILP